ncbi:MAG: hypothetical protein GY820_07195 [Gammaproteobacteria bacterium]|nr:hypothetical protein [Gammaproteobacteria bacterium]
MSIVIVCTSDKLHNSISKVDKKYRQSGNQLSYIAPVLTDFFLESDSSNSLRTRTGSQVYSCTIDDLITAFQGYIKQELFDHPRNEEIITHVRDLILSLFRSDWPVKNNLVVSECLDESDLLDLNTFENAGN